MVFTGCGNYLLCLYSSFGNPVKDFATGYLYNLTNSVNCETRNDIYYIWISHNDKVYPYIGRSSYPKKRFSSPKTHSSCNNLTCEFNCGTTETHEML